VSLSTTSIKNPVFAWMLMAALIVFGWIGFTRMGVSQLPDVDFPVLSVRVTYEGAAPVVMETDLVDVIEESVMTIQGIREVSSSARQGQATITVEFDLDKDIDVALQEVQTNIAQAQRRLPDDMDPAIVSKTNPEDQPIMWIGISGDRPKRDLMEYVQDHLKDRFQTINGVGEIFLGGFLERNLRVWLDAAKLEEYQITVEDVIASIQREHQELPAGRIETMEHELNVRAMGEALSMEEFGQIVIAQRGGSPVYKPIYLKDVATIEDGLADERRIARIMGKTAVGLGIRKQRGANAVEVAHKVKARLEEVKQQLPQDLEIGINFDRSQFIEDSISELNFTLVLSAILTSLVCWAFLGSWGSTVNVLLAIPTSIIGTFFFLNVMGFTLNTFTMLGLSLAVGVVVDDAIMVLENIVRYQERGEGRVRAALLGSNEISFAAFAATVAVIAIFLPVAFMQGIVGKFFFQFGVTVSIAVALSLLEALTLTPMRCSQFLTVTEQRSRFGHWVDAGFDRLARGYRSLLVRSLRVRWLVILGAVAVFVGSFALLKPLRKEFVPPQDQSMFLCRIQTPVGSSIDFTSERFKQAEAFIMSRPEVRRYFGAIGGFGGGEVNTGILFVVLHPPRERAVVPPAKHRLTQQELIAVCRKALNEIPDVRAYVQDLSQSGFTAERGFPVEFTVRGPEWGALASHTKDIRRRMEATGLMVDVDSNYEEGITEVQVVPDRVKAAERGVSVAAIARTINATIGGERVAKYTRGGRRYDARVRLRPEDRAQPSDIGRLWVRNNRGELIQLSDVVRLEEHEALQTITRRGRERAISVYANVAAGKSQTDAIRAVEQIAKEVLPEHYFLVLSGSAQTFREAFTSLLFALCLGIVVSYMVLASQFNSFVHPLTVLLALPFSISGAFVALLMSNQSLNLYSFIGLILLMGLVKKNSILLVEFTNQIRARGTGVHDALLEACPIRLRPIIMTSLSTIAAAVPPALAIGPGAETRIPMAVAVMGGMIFSTLLTLFVVPCAYSLLARVERKPPAELAHLVDAETEQSPHPQSAG